MARPRPGKLERLAHKAAMQRKAEAKARHLANYDPEWNIRHSSLGRMIQTTDHKPRESFTRDDPFHGPKTLDRPGKTVTYKRFASR